MLAHHGWAWTSKNFELTGVIKKVSLGNPHGVLRVDIDGALGAPHGFTHVGSDRYQKRADELSWQAFGAIDAR